MTVENMGEFFADLDAFGNEIEDKVREVRATIAFWIYGQYIAVTPVDTGFARSGWAWAEGRPGESVPTAKGGQRYGSPSLAGIEAEMREAGDSPYGVLWIWNNVVYIVALDEGHSQQAPAGMSALVRAGLGPVLAEVAR